MKINYKILITSLLIVYSVAFIGSFFTSPNTNTGWYLDSRPDITPPDLVFPIVWNILFFLIAMSLYFSWINSNKSQKKKVAFVFGLNLFLNITWSFLFFVIRKPYLAFFELIILGLSILAMIYTTYKIDKKASYMLIPYLVWVTFAGVLNYLWIA